MPHLTAATLRPYLDHELTEADRAQAEDHLAGCAACRAELATLEARAAQVNARLAALAPGPAEAPRPAHAALALLNRKADLSMTQKLFSKRLRPLWAGLTLVALLVVSFSFAPVRALASNFLGLFRVQKISIVEVDPAVLNRYNNTAVGQQLEQLFKDVQMTGGGEAQAAASAEEAAPLAGFTPRLPAALADTPRLQIQPGQQASYVLDVPRLQSILDEIGRSDVRLPKELDGQTVTFNLPTMVTALYGQCPNTQAQFGYDPSDPDDTGRTPPTSMACQTLMQLPAPTVNAPAGLDLPQLGAIMLELAGMTPEQARQFSQNIDWATTLVVPVPRSSRMQYLDVQVDGVAGTLITASDQPAVADYYTLIWIKDGRLYALIGTGTAAEALDIAGSLK